MTVNDKIAKECRKQIKTFTVKRIKLATGAAESQVRQIIKRFVLFGELKEEKINRILYYTWIRK